MATGVAVLEPGVRTTDGAHSAFPSYRVLGIRVHGVQIPDAVATMRRWVEERGPCRYVVVTGMTGITEALRDRAYLQGVNSADLCAADGWPVMMMGRLAGHRMERRVYGPELMQTFIERTERLGFRHFFYGGAPGVADELARRFKQRCPGIEIAGTYCPPFGPVRPEEDPAVLERINSSRADVLWVGLGTPKQERWMYLRRPHLKVPVLVGVGAAFDFHTGRVPQAPPWVRDHGFEWLFRLVAEPRRLWRRYLVDGGLFAVRLMIAIVTGGIRKGT